MDFVDLYCERVAPALLGEPFNLATNLAFLGVAAIGWQAARRQGRWGAEAKILTGLIVAFGIGSGLFHSFANTLTRWLDALPIALFMAAYLFIYVRAVLNASTPAAGIATGAFVAAAAVARLLPPALNGSVIYAPALVLVVLLGIVHCAIARHQAWMLLAAAGAFTGALVMRTLDAPLCAWAPTGTHFVWHLGTALAIYFAMRGLIPHLPARRAGRSPPQNALAKERA